MNITTQSCVASVNRAGLKGLISYSSEIIWNCLKVLIKKKKKKVVWCVPATKVCSSWWIKEAARDVVLFWLLLFKG